MFTLKRILAFVLSQVMKNAIYKKISLLSSIHKRGCLGFVIKKIEMPVRNWKGNCIEHVIVEVAEVSLKIVAKSYATRKSHLY